METAQKSARESPPPDITPPTNNHRALFPPTMKNPITGKKGPSTTVTKKADRKDGTTEMEIDERAKEGERKKKEK